MSQKNTPPRPDEACSRKLQGQAALQMSLSAPDHTILRAIFFTQTSSATGLTAVNIHLGEEKSDFVTCRLRRI